MELAPRIQHGKSISCLLSRLDTLRFPLINSANHSLPGETNYANVVDFLTHMDFNSSEIVNTFI